jgi:hypothetical protein
LVDFFENKTYQLSMSGQTRIFILFIFLQFFIQNSAFSQGWERVFNEFSIKGEVLRAVVSTADDGLLVLGVSGTDAPEGPRSYLLKVDADGVFQWKKDLYPDTFGMEAWKMVKMESGRLMFLSIEKAPGNAVPTYWTFTCDQNGENSSGPHLLVASSEAKKAWDLAPKSGGGAIVTGRYKVTPTLSLAYIQTLSELGVTQQSFPIPSSDSLVLASVASISSGGFISAGYFRENGDEDSYLIRLNSAGAKIWDYRLNDLPNNQDTVAFNEVAPAQNGDFWVVGSINILRGAAHDTLFVQKFNANGQPIFKKNFALNLSFLEYGGFDRSKIIPTDDGGLVVLYETFLDGPGEGGEDLNITKLDANGNILWSRRYGREARFVESPFDICKTNNGFAVASWLDDKLFSTNDGYLLRTDSEGKMFSNYVEGHVYLDENLDCTFNFGEKPLVGWQIQALRQNELVYNVLTDVDGKYALPTDTGSLTLKLIAPNPAWDACQMTQTVNFSQPFDSILVNFLAQPAVDCAVMEADISTLLLRRCFESNYTITYANRGTQAIPNANLELQLDSDLTFVSADFPIANQSGQTTNFSLGTLEIGDFGQIHLTVLVGCDSTILGQTHCSTVKILPQVQCLPSANWTGAHIEVDAICTSDSIFFNVKNTGLGGIGDPVGYIIVEEELLLRTGQINVLPAGADMVIPVAANGKTYRIEAEPEPYDPYGLTKPSVAIEGCGTDTTGSYSTSYVTIFPNDDGNPTADTDCRMNQGSFDPNRKDGFPTGYGENKYILPTTEIEYMIQFQNTGTDTAFSVILRDTLDKWLDVSTVRAGAASHDFKLEMLGSNVLKFIFNPIALPDSSKNEPKSHGFASFRIKPKANVPLQTLIQNRVAIYFDFNSPVLTNKTSHRIDTGFIVKKPLVSIFEAKNNGVFLKIDPNPVSDFTKIEWSSFSENKAYYLRVRSVSGQILRDEKTIGGSHIFYRENLPNGVYFIEILDNQQVMSVGRLILI